MFILAGLDFAYGGNVNKPVCYNIIIRDFTSSPNHDPCWDVSQAMGVVWTSE